jgi:anthranilate synthase component 2
LKTLIAEFAHHKAILGVCLGHQAIAEVFGATLKNLPQVFHGVSTDIFIKDKLSPLFKGLDSPQKVGRYHSWVVDQDSLPDSLMVTATDEFGNIMGLRHKNLNVQGVQFHPESIMTDCGEKIMRNWLLN